MPPTGFPQVTWGIFVDVDPVVMPAISMPLASRVLPVFADGAVAAPHVGPKFPGVFLSLDGMSATKKQRAIIIVLKSIPLLTS